MIMQSSRKVLAAAIVLIGGLAVAGCESSQKSTTRTASDEEWRQNAASGADMSAQPAGSTVQPGEGPMEHHARPNDSQLPYDTHDSD
jgi:hypothetical protein